MPKQRHPQPGDAELHQIMRPIEQLVAERDRLRVARAELRQDNAALRSRLEALTQAPPESPSAESGWEAYSAGVQNGYDHKVEGTQPNWFAVRADYDAWLEQVKA